MGRKKLYTDNHGAAKSGAKSENKFKHLAESWGYSFLKNKDEFINNFGPEKGLVLYKQVREISIPHKWEYAEKKTFQSDGYISELDSIIELKYSQESGTTEEKVMYDLIKIREGVYSHKKLIYIFFGPRSKKCDIFKHFQREVKNFDPNEEKVKVIIDDSEELCEVKQYLQNLQENAKISA